MRRLRQQFATAYAAYASKVLLHAPSTLTNSKYKCYSSLFQAMKHVFYVTIYHFYFVLCYILALHVSDCCGNEFLVVYWKFVSILKNRLCQVLSSGMSTQRSQMADCSASIKSQKAVDNNLFFSGRIYRRCLVSDFEQN